MKNEYTAAENLPSEFRKQHDEFSGFAISSPTLAVDVALDVDVIDEGQHKDCMFYLQMRTAFNARTQPRDSLLGRMSEVRDGAQGASSLAEKYFSFLREVDKPTQAVLAVLTTELPNGMCRKSYARYLGHLRIEIMDAMIKFSAWTQK